MADPEPLVDSYHVAEYLGVRPHSLDAWAYKGIGPKFLKVGHLRRYRMSDVLAWLEASARG